MSGRYDSSTQLQRVDAGGRRVRYLAPRILPLGASVAGPATARVAASERHRLDLVAYRTLRNPMLAWRIADANDAMDPFELCERAGTVLKLPASDL